MNIEVIKKGFFLLLMIMFIIMAFNTKDVIYGKLFASLGIISGVLASLHFSNNKQMYNE